MQNNQEINLSEYVQIERITMTKDITIILTSVGTILFFIFGLLFTFIFDLIGKVSSSSSSSAFSWVYIITFIIVIASTFVIHELIHGLFVTIFKGKPTYGAGISHYILPYFYTTTETPFSKNKFIIIALAPLVLISILAIVVVAIIPSLAEWLLLPCIINASGAVGDIWLVSKLLKLPKDIVVKDDKTGTTLYSKDKNLILKERKESTIIKNFSVGFGLSFIIIYILIILLSLILSLLNINEFTLGIKDYFYMFQLIINPKLELKVNFIPILIFCILIGFIFSILKHGTRLKDKV